MVFGYRGCREAGKIGWAGRGISVYIYMLRGLRLAIRGLEDYGLAGLGGWGLGSERIKD